jgi:putative hemolysin
MLLAYIFVLLALIFSAFFSGSEIAFVSANRLKMRVKLQEKTWGRQMLSKFYDKPSSFLGTMLVGNNIALVIFGMLTESLWSPALRRFLPDYLSGDFAVLLSLTLMTTIIVLIFGEYLPKVIFRLFAEKFLLAGAYAIGVIYWVLYPITWAIVKLSDLLIKHVFKIKAEQGGSVFTQVDLERFMSDINEDSKGEEPQINKELFAQALQLKVVKVQDCYIPLSRVKYVDSEATMPELRKVLVEEQFSRIPVFDKKSQTFTGYIHHQSIFKYPQAISEAILDIVEVHIADDGYKVLNEFIMGKRSIASVIEESGKVVGIITLEDILEQIFGKIEDEHDDMP